MLWLDQRFFAYKNAGGEIDLPEALLEMMNRGKAVRVAYVDSGVLVGWELVQECLYQ